LRGGGNAEPRRGESEIVTPEPGLSGALDLGNPLLEERVARESGDGAGTGNPGAIWNLRVGQKWFVRDEK
jgi:hypothetical protein